ncbi:MAG: hypothetical protein AAF447_27060 [Myxococcota bacterium]
MKACARRLLTFALTLGLLAAPGAARGDEPLRLLSDPISYTDVVDAAEAGDRFDLHARVAFRRTRLTGRIQRETGDPLGVRFETVGRYLHLRNELELGLDVGLFRDTAFYARLPLVLRDDRRLDARGAGASRLDAPGTAGREPLFELPFISPTRSGIDELRLGVAFSPLNQARRPESPTWTFRTGLDLGVGRPLRPCAANQEGCSPGVSPATHAFTAETRLSRRYRSAEVYTGLGMALAWTGRAEGRYAPAGALPGHRRRRPPTEGFWTVGTAFLPWENREAQQRLSLDVRGHLHFFSPGRDYSPLFDALGASDHPALTTPACEGAPAPGQGCEDAGLALVPFTGLTDVQQRLRLGTTLGVELRVARYVAFRFASTLAYQTPYLLTFTRACNSGTTRPASDPRSCAGGIRDPHHRPVIDLPGQRFRMDGATILAFRLEARAMF